MAKSSKHEDKLYETLQDRLGYSFSDFSNLKNAVTHSSVRSKKGHDDHYERLEFLGDRVLGLCVAELLHFSFPDAKEGELSLRFNALVRGKTLAQIADELGLHEFIRTGDDLKSITGKRMQSVRADVMEAVIASIYLDGGLDEAKAFIKRFWTKRVAETDGARRDPKTALQEWAHSNQFGTPTYEETGRTGPDHDPEFSVLVHVSGNESVAGHGRSKRIAEQEAATKMLVAKGVWQKQQVGKST